MALRHARFLTAGGLEVPPVTAAGVREIDRIAIEETGPNLFQMMENAGRNLALQAIEGLGPDWREQQILVLAAPLAAGGVPAFQQHVYAGTSGRQIEADAVHKERPDLIIDALIGYGLTTAPRGVAAELIVWANGTGAPNLSLDVPSGVDATTGDTPGVAVRPRWTMTLALPKTGLHPEHTGQLVLADIGIPAEAFRRAGLVFINPFGGRFRVPLTMA